MYSDNLSKRSMPLPYQQNKNNLVTSLKNTYNTQGQNIYSNTKIINNSNSSIKQINLNNSYNYKGNNSIGKIQSLKTIAKKSTSSSGTLYKSSRSKKYNRVFKNGLKIRNIDINNDYEDIKNEDTESQSTNAITKKRNSLSTKNIINSRNESLTQNKLSATESAKIVNEINGNQLSKSVTSPVNPTPKMNIFAAFINKILDKINPNINKTGKKLDPYNNEEIMQPKTYIGELNSQNNISTIKLNQNINLNNKSNNVINKVSNNDIIKNNNISTKTTKNNGLINAKQNELSKQQKQSSNKAIEKTKQNNTIQKNNVKASLSSNQNSKLPLTNQQLDKTINNNESYIILNIKNPPNIPKKEEDIKSKKSESKSSNNKFPFQPLKDILNSPKSKKSSNITKTNTNTNTNTNPNNHLSSPSDTYLVSHLNEHLQKEVLPTTNNLDENYTQSKSKGKGFRFCSELSQAGKEADGALKIDQDTSLIKLSVGEIIGFNMFGVLDGHGPDGHYVSQYGKDYFIKNLENYTHLLKITRGITSSEEIYNELKSKRFEYIIELFNLFDIELTKQNVFDYTISGTTCNIILQFNKHLICFSVGDSRCILVYDKGDYTNQGIIPLSTDHKPNLPGEIERIQICGGEVDTMKDDYGNRVGPPRVYKLGFNYPGLAMSRSLGDFQAKEVGVVSTPQIIEYDINDTTKFLVVCSDGVWEFMSNEQVRDIGNIFYASNDVANFCTELVRYSMILWEQYEMNRDDITVVSVFF